MTRARNSANLASHGNLFVDITNDRTGIGSVVPGQSLHVAGTAGFHADVTFTGDLYNTTWDRSTNSLKFSDSALAYFGSDNDLSISHNGTHGYIHAATGGLYIKVANGEFLNRSGSQVIAKFLEGTGGVQLYHNNSKKFESTAYGTNTTGTAVNDGLVVAGVATVTTMNVTGVLTYDDVTSVDSVGIVTARQGVRVTADGSNTANYISVGAGDDFRLFHDGSNTYLKNNTGDLYLKSSSNDYIRGISSTGSVQLKYGSTTKFSTENHGASLTGNLNIYGVVNANVRLQSGANTVYASVTFFNAAGSASNSINSYAASILFITGRDATVFSDSSAEICEIVSSGIHPRTASTAAALGTSSKRWDNVYADAADIAGDLTITDTIVHSGDTNTKIRFPAADTIQFETAGSAVFRIDSAGRVRTDSGTQVSDFDITRSNSTITDVMLVKGNVGNGFIRFQDNDASSNFTLGVDDGAGTGANSFILYDRVNSAYRIRVNDSGHVLPGADSTTDIGTNSVRWRNVYADTLYGDGSNLTGITQTAINNNADNRVITGSGTANTLEAESGLTYNGTTLQLAAADDIRIAGGTWTGEYTGGIKIQPDASNSYFQYHGGMYFRNSAGANRLYFDSAGNTTIVGNLTVNGTYIGSGASLTNVNATTLDSIDSSSFLRSDADDAVTNYNHKISYYSNSAINTSTGNQASLECFNGTVGNDAFMSFHVGGDFACYFGLDGGINDIAVGGWSMGAVSNRVWHAGNDGSGSGLDADTVDGIQGASFLRSDAADSVSAAITFTSGSSLNLSTNDIYLNARVINNQAGGSDDGLYIGYQNANSGVTRLYGGGATSGGLDVRGSGVNDVKINGNTVWHAGNDGSGSGLDADTLDGVQGANFLRSDANDSTNSTLTVQRLGFGGVGSNSGNTSSSYAYNIFQEGGTWTSPFPDLRINYHTGIILAANTSYGGVRFQKDYNDTTELFSVGNGDNHVRVANNLIVSGTLTVGGAAVLTAADFPSQGTKITATGGNSITTHNSHKIHDFVGSGTFEITAGAGEVEVLIVAGGGSEGGGGSGCHGGGGGGGGGVVNRFVTLGIGKYYVVVGAGGVFRSNGGNSSAFGLVALGGGAGGATLSANGNAGGSGGGGSRDNNSNQGGAATQPTSDAGGLGNAGGRTGPSNTSPGGGGGAGGAGATGNAGGAGGPGKQFTQFNNNTYFGAGGSSGGNANGAGNTGQGGGGSPGGGPRYSGGSGRVMIRYPV